MIVTLVYEKGPNALSHNPMARSEMVRRDFTQQRLFRPAFLRAAGAAGMEGAAARRGSGVGHVAFQDDVLFFIRRVVGGYGGGHNIAAGATIPRGTEEKFLDAVDDMVLAQLI